MTKRLFPLGRIYATPGAIEAFKAADLAPTWVLALHVIGDSGELCADDIEANKQALIHDTRILSSYKLPGTGVKVWVITEADRSVTTLLLPEEY